MAIVETGLLLGAGAIALNAAQESIVDDGPESTGQSFEVNIVSTGRGVIVPLSAQQRVNRARYLAGELRVEALDIFVRRPTDGRTHCPVIYYRLSDYNGGKDPGAPDPASYWRASPGAHMNVTSDCIGGAAWCGGFDRYQPARFAHIYEGWVNTDSMIMDALGPARCFRKLSSPEPGCFVVAATGSGKNKSIGHIGVVVDVPADWSDWSRIGVVDIAARGAGIRANIRNPRGAAGWQQRDGIFVVSTMK